MEQVRTRLSRIRWSRSLMGLCLVLGLWVSAHPPDLVAQTGAEDTWSAPLVLFDGTGHFVVAPCVVSDAAGNVHVFWQYGEGVRGAGLNVIYYSRWDGTSWSVPVDVLIPPVGSIARDPAVAVDSAGRLHVIWNGDRLYYSWAPAQAAIDVHAWAPAQPLAEYSTSADIVVDAQGTLYVVYSAAGADTYCIRSDNGGQNWSAPIRVSLASTDRATDWARLTVDDEGILHLVWTQYPLPELYPPSGVFYSRSTDGGYTWSLPLELAGQHHGMANVAVDGQGMIHVVWDGDASTHGRFHRRSADGGTTWSEAVDLTGGIKGLAGDPQMVVDSAGTLHLVTADTLGGSTGGTLYTYWTSRGWAPPVDLAPEGGDWYGERVAMGISEGNRLHVLAPAGFQRLWYTTRRVPAPHLPGQPLPTLTPAPSPTSAPSPESTTPTAIFIVDDTARGNQEPGLLNEPWVPLAVALLPVALLLMVAIMVRGFRIGNR